MTEKDESNQGCTSELHDQHLCYIISQGFHLTEEQKYKDMVGEPRYFCQHCGRVAKSGQNLCEPAEL